MLSELLRRVLRPKLGRRSVAVAVMVATCVGAATEPAAAHGADGAPSSNYVTEIVTITTSDPSSGSTAESFTLRSIEAGSRLELRWRRGPEIAIPDYDGYPYLRVGPTGAFANTQSNAYYLNADRNGSTAIPDGIDPAGPPSWKRLSDEPLVRWHDHRAHRMGGLPDEVRAHPNRRHLVQEDTVTFVQGATTWSAAVRVRWVPGPSPWPWVGATAAAVGALLGLGLGRRRVRRRYALVGALLVLLIAVDLAHLAGIAFGIGGGLADGLRRMSTVGFASIAAWIAGLLGVRLLRRGRDDGFYLATFAAGLMTVVGGLADVGVLSRTSTVFAAGSGAARVLVSATMALGVAVVVLSVAGTQVRPQSDASNLST